MDENHQDRAHHNSATTETKLWLPPSYINTNNKTPIAPAPKKRGIKSGFADKSFWEWLMLVGTLLAALGAIAIPVAIAVGTTWFSYQQNQTNQQIAMDQQQEIALQTYLDRMSDLLLNQNLRRSKPGDEVQTVARARTLTVLSQLNATRKDRVLQFLLEAGLISGNNVIISLANADLEGVNLQGYLLKNTDFGNANLEGANLQYTTLINVNLAETNLIRATLANSDIENTLFQSAQLSYANLSSSIFFHSDLSYANLNYANLTDIISLDNDLEASTFYGTKLIASILVNTTFDSSNMTNANLIFATLSGSSFRNSILIGANLKNTYLAGTDVEIFKDKTGYIGGIFYPVNSKLLAQNNDLPPGYFFKSSLSPTSMMAQIDLGYPFIEVSFSDLSIPHQPTDTDVSGADLTNANLSGANATNTQLAKAKSLKGATMPDGSIHP